MKELKIGRYTNSGNMSPITVLTIKRNTAVVLIGSYERTDEYLIDSLLEHFKRYHYTLKNFKHYYDKLNPLCK